jgi:hypothetical protein
MIPETTVMVPVPVETITVEATLPPEQVNCATVVQAPPTQEQVQAAEAVFSQQHQRAADPAFALLGVWTSTVLLRDLAIDAFSGAPEEEEEANRLTGREEDQGNE